MASEPPHVDPAVWKSCAGTSVHIPPVHSAVYYFPQGHAEQSSLSLTVSPLVTSRPMIPCRVSSLNLLAHPDTDEVFARIRLLPAPRKPHVTPQNPHDAILSSDDDVLVSFAKVLTPSDANNGGGFSVPRFCADSIFPPLNFNADPPVQNISITDVHGVVWEFRHIYRGTPRRHLLTTGWSKFVNSKKLVAGDSVVFMRNVRSGELFVGLRRAVRSGAGAGGRWNYPVGSVKGEGEGVGSVKVERSGGRARVTAEEVVEATGLAVQGREFEVVVYPRGGGGWADFVVGAEAVEESLRVAWSGGMRVKMAVETEDSSRVSWVQGTVSLAVVPDSNSLWQSSPWRMLQVTWDEPEALHNVNRVSPWQVQYVVPTPPLHSTFPSSKKAKVSRNPELLTDGDRDLFFPMNVFGNSPTGNLNPYPSSMNYDYFPVGMQGARQDTYYVANLSNFICENSHNIFSDELIGKNAPEVETISTELNIGSSHCDNLSPDSQSSVHFLENELTGKEGCSPSTKVTLGSFQLFGQIIHAPVKSGYDGVGYAEGNQISKKMECGKNSLDLSLTSPYTKLRDGLDVHCRRASAGEACSL